MLATTYNQNQTQNFMTAISALSSLAQFVQQTQQKQQENTIPTLPTRQEQLKKAAEPPLESLFSSYINSLIDETAKWRGYKKSCLCSWDIYDYWRYGQWSKEKPCLFMKNIDKRISRISKLKDVNVYSLRSNFNDELCKEIGLSHHEVCMEPQIISRHFNWGFKYRHFSFAECIDMNKNHLKKAIDIIFKIEAQNGIYDADYDYGVKLNNEFAGIQETGLNNKEYKKMFERIAKEYARICKLNLDDAIRLAFKFVENSMKSHIRTQGIFENYSFSGDYLLDMCDVLSNKQLREEFLGWAMYVFRFVWSAKNI